MGLSRSLSIHHSRLRYSDPLLVIPVPPNSFTADLRGEGTRGHYTKWPKIVFLGFMVKTPSCGLVVVRIILKSIVLSLLCGFGYLLCISLIFLGLMVQVVD